MAWGRRESIAKKWLNGSVLLPSIVTACRASLAITTHLGAISSNLKFLQFLICH